MFEVVYNISLYVWEFRKYPKFVTFSVKSNRITLITNCNPRKQHCNPQKKKKKNFSFLWCMTNNFFKRFRWILLKNNKLGIYVHFPNMKLVAFKRKRL